MAASVVPGRFGRSRLEGKNCLTGFRRVGELAQHSLRDSRLQFFRDQDADRTGDHGTGEKASGSGDHGADQRAEQCCWNGRSNRGRVDRLVEHDLAIGPARDHHRIVDRDLASLVEAQGDVHRLASIGR